MLLPGLDRRSVGTGSKRSHTNTHQYSSHRYRNWDSEHLHANQQPDTDYLDRNRFAHSHRIIDTHDHKHPLPTIDVHIHLHTNCDDYSYLYANIYPLGDTNLHFDANSKRNTHQNQYTNKYSHFPLSDEHCYINTDIDNSIIIPIF